MYIKYLLEVIKNVHKRFVIYYNTLTNLTTLIKLCGPHQQSLCKIIEYDSMVKKPGQYMLKASTQVSAHPQFKLF